MFSNLEDKQMEENKTKTKIYFGYFSTLLFFNTKAPNYAHQHISMHPTTLKTTEIHKNLLTRDPNSIHRNLDNILDS